MRQVYICDNKQDVMEALPKLTTGDKIELKGTKFTFEAGKEWEAQAIQHSWIMSDRILNKTNRQVRIARAKRSPKYIWE